MCSSLVCAGFGSIVHAEETLDTSTYEEFTPDTVVAEIDSNEPTEGVYGKQIEPSDKETANDLETASENDVLEHRGVWSYRPGVICIDDSTSSSGIIKHGHAGIMGIEGTRRKIVEANPGSGVSSFRSKFHSNKVWQVEVISTSRAQDEAAARWANRQIGKGYNAVFFDINNRSRFYCSHLVWAAYKDTCGVNLNLGGPQYFWSAIHPSEFIVHPNTRLIYRKH